jgi:tetratricopeptide (TPR) repeat protein
VQAIDLRLALRSALFPSSDSARILACLREAEALAIALDDHRRLGQISGFLSAHFRNQGAYDQAITSSQRALALATADGDVVLQALANLFLGAAHSAQGDYHQAIACLEQTAAFLDGARRRERFGQATLPTVQACAFLAAGYAELGMFTQGRMIGEEGLQIAEAMTHPGSLMWGYYGLGLLALRQGDMARALPRLEQAMAICQEADLPIFAPRMATALGTGYALAGRAADAMALLTQAMDQTKTTAMAGFQALYHLAWGEVHMRAGRLEEAHTFAKQALARAREYQERGHQAYALCLLGEVAARCHPSPAEEIETHYRQGLALAEALGMRPLVAHAHHGLGTLYSTIDRREQARAELSVAIELYRAMAMYFWLPQAEATLVRMT